MRAALGALLLLHGLIHLMGFAKAFDFAALEQLTRPISRPMGLLWLVAGLLMCVAAFLPSRAFWWVTLLAVVTSQTAILNSWSDAKWGTLVNVTALLAAVYAFAARGPISLAAEYATEFEQGLQRSNPGPVLTEAELAPLPEPVQKYLRVSGTVGQARPGNFRARWKGRIRGAAADPWMEFTAEQFNTVGVSADRLFLMDAVMKGLPTDVFHRFVGEAATFRVRVLSLWPVLEAKGPEMNRSETVTIFNDLCMLAPGALADPRIRWQDVSATSARAVYTRGAQAISAELRFDASGMLVDFITDDRSRAAPDGKSFARLRWSTPLSDPRRFGPLLVASHGEAVWHEPGTGGYAYIEMELLDLTHNVSAR